MLELLICRRVLRVGLFCSLAALAGCVDASDAPTTSTSNGENATAAAEATVEASRLEPVELATFVGTWDPETQRLDLALDEAVLDASGLRDVPQALYCERRVTSGRPDTLGLATEPGSIQFTPTDCGFPDAFPYDTLGMFCFDATVTSYFRTPIPALYAEVTSVTPDIGHNGYLFPNGTGADPAGVVAGASAPDAALGLGAWAYGDMNPSEATTVQWALQYTPEPFTFRGRLVAAVPELRNGIDDNCDGLVDEGPFADGETCSDGSECFSGACDGASGLCVTECPVDTWGPDCTPCNCDDGLFCNGVEICDPVMGCQAGMPPTLDDGVSCTVDTCDEGTDTIVNAPDDSLCDDLLFCNGVETCDAVLDCQNGTAPSLDDGVGCTIDTCDEGLDAVVNTTNDAACTNGLFCDGDEYCDATLDCQAGASPVVDDGNACTLESCDEGTDTISSGLTPHGIFATASAFAALRSDGSVITWGSAAQGGNSSAVSASLGSGVIGIANTGSAFAAWKADGSVVTWGDGTAGGDSSAVSASLTSVVHITSDNLRAFAALQSNGSVVTWGDSLFGGDSSSVSASLTSGVVSVEPSQYAFAAVKADGSVVTWGDASSGGDSSSVSASLTSGVVEVVGISGAFAALKSDGSVVSWGNPTVDASFATVSASLASGVVEIFHNSQAFAALKNDGSLVTWGAAPYGGDSSSVAASLTSGVVEVAGSGFAFAALKADGSVVAWGDGLYGGDASGVAASLTGGVASLHANTFAFAARKSDGSVIVWGNGANGGNASAVAASLASGVVDVFGGWVGFAALKADGSLVTWGNPASGGDSSAVAASLASGVASAVGTQSAFAALKTDGSIVTWGNAAGGGDSSSVSASLGAGVMCVP